MRGAGPQRRQHDGRRPVSGAYELRGSFGHDEQVNRRSDILHHVRRLSLRRGEVYILGVVWRSAVQCSVRVRERERVSV